MNTLKVENLKYSYGKVEALKGISFEVSDGLVGILGPNGAGKTTAMKLITTLFSIQSGDVYLNDLDYKKDLSAVRRNLGYLPQDFTTYGNLKGREFLEIIADLKVNWDRNKVKSYIGGIIESLNMEEYIDRKIKEYSGGMKQKLGFAQVMVGDPKVIVVDEPTVGLDPEQRNYIREIFPIISKNRIVLATTHIVEDIEAYCTHLLVIKEGRLIYNGKKENFIKETEGMIWQGIMEGADLARVRDIGQVLTTRQTVEGTQIKYISKEPLTSNSIKISANLQDAYIIHSTLADEGR
ncbi:ABC transporter ATP-binding protein [Clostridium algidicarnis]|uniref:ABC transporter ATP-binding protein n=1 Tax=Clostridium algidicarnis TaxID=37659 RepID=UPI001C0C7E5B|nr:ATP-binding cassette domain-containing protein [Clostridium algidicarnis]MBU3208163.1 ATP-binding cassette domain-containing protein [Clostridium algidicarnis]MBU3227606.1 ATP-binding cassette domain-containing protein [Clostridium algidicarnis]MBU3250988.1 ATP-binding cassette domain-containing protein [Clostridium algidicarnis]